MAQRTLRMPDTLEERVRAAVQAEGYHTSSAFRRAAIVERLSGGRDETGIEEAVPGSLHRISVSPLRTQPQTPIAIP